MGIVRFPYRWLPRTVWSNLCAIPQDISNGVRNIIRWTPVIWHDQDWDWAYLARIMAWKMERMSKALDAGPTLDGHECATQLKACALLLKRLEEDNYYDSADGYETGDALAKQDQQNVARIIGENLRSWWN